ncbi:uncharacterized protein LOC117525094 [Thalassophryne amazonica]|uniref:uncharacterized protein LOC117525094 n=1 Tax=Thalassophryne amazonica TaxID=390379 RepID=UPI0014712030|nr:uncharacterized protein LOC117525094 [Thalassophryne amazonica]
MFGREARLPIDICFGISPNGESESSYQQYVARMRKELQKAYQLASDAATNSHLRNKAYYDHRVRDLPLEKGDRVLVQNVGQKGKHKLQDRWKSTPYVVVEKLSNLPVYKVKPELGPGIVKTLHRDHLLPIGYLVRMSNPPDVAGPTQRPVTRSQHPRPCPRTKPTDPVEESDTVSSDTEFDTVQNPQGFVVDEVRKQNASPNQDSRETENRESSEEDSEGSEEEEIQPVIESESEGSSIGDTSAVMDSDAQETNYDSVEDQVLEGRANSPSSTRVRSGKSVKSARSGSEKSSTVRKSQREPKPAMRLTCDKPGYPSSEPVTIMHHGMVIQLKLNPPDQTGPEARQKPKTSKRMSENERKSHTSKLKREKRCDEDIYTFRRGRV